MNPDLSINPSVETGKITEFIRTTVREAGFTKVVLGLSGGIDSAVSFVLAVKALGAQNVHAGIFPYGGLNKEGEEDAKQIISNLKFQISNLHRIDIKPLVDPLIDLDNSMDNTRKGNVIARLRMILLYDLSKKIPALVLGTENRTEHLLGYYTRFGDGASDIEPIVHLYKTQVRQLARCLGIPEKIIQKAPTAGLWDGQTDEGEFGFSYGVADKILYLHVDQKKTKEEMLNEGHEAGSVEKILSFYRKNGYKSKLPYSL